MRNFTRGSALLLTSVSLLVASAMSAQAQISYSGGTYTENFNTLTQSTTAQTLANGTAVPNITGFFAKASDSNSGASSSSGGNYLFAADTGASNTGRIYSYGSTGSSDRALGSLSSGTPDYLTFGTGFVNSTGTSLTSFTVTYTGEQWRVANTTPQSLGFFYKVFAAGTGNLGSDIYAGTSGEIGAAGGVTPDVTWTRFSALDFTSPINSATAGSLDGNLAANRALVTGTVTLNVAAGQEVWIRWLDADSAGNDDGLAVDDLSFSAVTAVTPPVGGAAPEPGSLALVALGALPLAGTILARRRRAA